MQGGGIAEVWPAGEEDYAVSTEDDILSWLAFG